MDLFDMVEHPEVNGLAEAKPFNWDEFVAGKPAVTHNGQIAYYGGHSEHPMCTHLYNAITTITDENVIKYGKEVMPFLVDERGYFEGKWFPFLVEMA
ncbi:hypothetical protein XK44_003654 [Salmonella enterica subsp. enterica]|uniref:Uncharacterized protein n=2 Tax=root TaxID=1 RepID=A0A6G8RAV3_9CAUD|nr:hypothetical protein [Salmonella enterica subsp. enterica serovar Kottbus]EBY8042322.1 hypothetical protein [Salmonella enterica subsp. enterica serovar Agona]EEJ2154897.1 hypothetical protein [Salmonella enterica subsp. enterica]QIN98507.1 hypothetical protein rivia_4 [Salmonella phage rivia]UVT36344.1 hypothetical protein Rostam_gp55c [Salmonella phage SE-SHZ-R]